MRTAAAWTLLVTVAFSMHSRAEDCELGQRYLSLAHDRIAAFNNDEAMAFLRQSIDACPSYGAYEQIGELAALSTERKDKEKAVAAFVEADARASSPEERARTLYHYAALLNQDGDPENAYPLIKQARALEPTDSEYAALASTVEKQVQHPTEKDIMRGVDYSLSLYKPLRVAALGTSASPNDHASSEHQTPMSGGGPSAKIPINFDTASVVVDTETRSNIAVLAHALADPSMAGRDFTFIGHSDFRGGDQYNVSLSLQRAEAIRQSVIALEPLLKGRIHIEGHGSREPIDPGTDDSALRANRRLQVVMDK
jgi:outer membrane protein OmpA-like peptidoglycan-associated protein